MLDHNEDGVQWTETPERLNAGVNDILDDTTDVGLGPRGREVLWELAFLRHCIQRTVNNNGWAPLLWTSEEFGSWLSTSSKQSQGLAEVIKLHNLTAQVVCTLRSSDLALMLGATEESVHALQNELTQYGIDDVASHGQIDLDKMETPGVLLEDSPGLKHTVLPPVVSMDSIETMEILPNACIPTNETLQAVEVVRNAMRMLEEQERAFANGTIDVHDADILKSTNALLAKELIEKTERLLTMEHQVSELMQNDVEKSLSFQSQGGGRTLASPVLPPTSKEFDEIHLEVPYIPSRSLTAVVGTPVVINVYNLGDSAALPVIGLGMYHSGLSIYGKEFAFSGSRQQEEDGTGIFWTQPMRALPSLVASHVVGMTRKSPTDVWNTVNKLALTWRRSTYNVFQKNCNHFTHTFAMMIVENPEIPSYINRAAMLGSIFSVKTTTAPPAIESFGHPK